MEENRSSEMYRRLTFQFNPGMKKGVPLDHIVSEEINNMIVSFIADLVVHIENPSIKSVGYRIINITNGLDERLHYNVGMEKIYTIAHIAYWYVYHN